MLFILDNGRKIIFNSFKKRSFLFLSKIKFFWLYWLSSMGSLCMKKLRVKIKGLWSESGSWSFRMLKFIISLYKGISEITYFTTLLRSPWIQVISLELDHFFRALQIMRSWALQSLTSSDPNKLIFP